jgi:hypothetical protein
MSINSFAAGLLDKTPTVTLAKPRPKRKWATMEDTFVFTREDMQKALGNLAADTQVAQQAITAYVRLPANPVHIDDALVNQPWRIKLENVHANGDLPALELCGDVFIGRMAGGINPDLDLTPYEGAELGVSRQHALLRPTTSRLLVLDLGSVNGTYLNETALDKTNPAAEVSDGDVLSFGKLHLKVRIIERP